MPSEAPEGKQNLQDMLEDIINNQRRVTPKEEADFIKQYLPEQDKKIKFVNTSKYLRFSFAILLLAIAYALLR